MIDLEWKDDTSKLVAETPIGDFTIEYEIENGVLSYDATHPVFGRFSEGRPSLNIVKHDAINIFEEKVVECFGSPDVVAELNDRISDLEREKDQAEDDYTEYVRTCENDHLNCEECILPKINNAFIQHEFEQTVKEFRSKHHLGSI